MKTNIRVGLNASTGLALGRFASPEAVPLAKPKSRLYAPSLSTGPVTHDLAREARAAMKAGTGDEHATPCEERRGWKAVRAKSVRRK